MLYTQRNITIYLLFFFISSSFSYANNNKVTFSHPGSINSKHSLDFIKGKIHGNKQPWFGEFNSIKTSLHAIRKPNAFITINAKNNSQASEMQNDAIAAYSQALLWYFSDDIVYANRAITILNAWSSFEGFISGTDQDKLLAGWAGAVFASAAEIMRSYEHWNPNEIKQFQRMFKRSFYPQLLIASSWNGNVDLTQIAALISIAVFTDDENAFNSALKRLEKRNPAYFYLHSDPHELREILGDGDDINHFWGYPTKWVNGLTQETCRDNGHHSQFALGAAIHVAEVAWNQGVDIYSKNQTRYVAALELLASQLLSNEVDTCKNKLATKSRFNTWEIGYNHYHNRADIALPFTKALIESEIRANSQRAVWNLVYETLTHAKLPKYY